MLVCLHTQASSLRNAAPALTSPNICLWMPLLVHIVTTSCFFSPNQRHIGVSWWVIIRPCGLPTGSEWLVIILPLTSSIEGSTICHPAREPEITLSLEGASLWGSASEKIEAASSALPTAASQPPPASTGEPHLPQSRQ